MSVKFSNNGKTTLSAGISASDTSVPVTDASVFPTITGSEYFYMSLEDTSGNIEIVKVTGVSSNTLTVTRAQESTTAQAFASGDKAENRLTAGGLNDVATQADTDTDTTYTAGTGLSLSGTEFSNSAPDQTVALTGAGATSISGTYPNFTITSTDTNTTYSVGDGGLTQNNFTDALKTKLDGVATNANNYTLPFTDNSSNWNTAFGWGNHASAGYLTSFDITSQTDPKYLRSDANDTFSNIITGNTLYLGGSAIMSSAAELQVNGFQRTGTIYLHEGLSAVAGNNWALETTSGGELRWNTNKLWHAGNDGSGSGLDADTLDGVQATGFLQTSGGTLSGNLTVSYTGNSTNDAGVYVNNDASDWGIKISKASGADYGLVIETNGDNALVVRNTSGANGFQVKSDGNVTAAGSVTATDVYINDTNTRISEGSADSIRLTTDDGYVDIGPMNSDWCHFQTDRTKFYFDKPVHFDGQIYNYASGATTEPYWHAGNDGSGSGLDADTVDGIEASSFLRSDANDVSSYNIQATNLDVTSNHGRGLRFWNGSDSYRIYMSGSTQSGAGRVSGETTSDYNMYFRMTGGTNRGFVFQNGTENRAGIDAAGNIRTVANVDCNYLRADRIYSNNDGSSGYFYNDSGARTAYTSGDFYFQTSVGNYYNYATNIYLGNTSGDIIRFRGNQVTHNGFSIDSDGDLSTTRDIVSTARDKGVFGTYNSYYTDQIWSMGTSYRNHSSGTNFGNLYGLAYKHTNNSTGGTMGGSHQMVWCQNGSPKCSLGTNIWTSGNVTAYSDIRVKTNIEHIPNALDKVCQLNGYTFDRTDVTFDEHGEAETPVRQTGVIAQEVLEVLPEAVLGDEEGHYSVAYGNMVGLLIESIKELKAEVNDLKAQLEAK